MHPISSTALSLISHSENFAWVDQGREGTKMADFEYRNIPLAALHLDIKNPRHEPQNDDLSEIKEFLAEQGSKIIRLIRDIASSGMHPAELPIVAPDDNDPQGFTVLEGNRRLLALRLLADPGLAEIAGKPSIKRALEQIARQPEVPKIDSLYCVVFPDRDEAAHWIELRHTGMNEGMGIVGWDSFQVARFNKTKYRIARMVAEHVRDNTPTDEQLRHAIPRMYLSTLARLVNDPGIREACGVQVDAEGLKFNLPRAEVDKALTRIVSDVALRKIKVGNVMNREDRHRYMGALAKENALPTPTAQRVDPYSVAAAQVAKRQKRGRPASTSRASLIASTCILKITEPRVNDVYLELRNLEVGRFTNCAAVMLRVFLELSLNAHAKNRFSFKPHGRHREVQLSDKILNAADYLEANKIRSRGELDAIRRMARDKNDLFGIPTLNAYVHNPNLAPRPTDLKITWNNMQSFMEALWPS
jgi:hypothetical protein